MKAESKIVLFYILNPTLGPREGEEHKKILWYYPQEHRLEQQVKQIGLCEAIIRFSGLFTEERGQLYSAVMEDQLQVYYEPEPDFIMGMGIDTSGGVKVHERVYKSMLEFAYKMFRLFFGTFREGGENGKQLGRLRKRLDFFYSRYVNGMTVAPVPLLDIFNGMFFTPLDRVNYLRIQTLVGRLQETFPAVNHTVLLYNRRLLWYSIPRDDMCILFRYLANNLLPAFTRQELEPTTPKSSVHHYGKFLTGPPDLLDPGNLGKIPGIFIQNEPNHLAKGGSTPEKESDSPADFGLQRFQLVIYRSLNATFCLLFDGEAELDFEFFKCIDLFLGPELGSIATGISELSTKPSPGSGSFDYIYYNGDTRSIRTTLEASLEPQPNGEDVAEPNPGAVPGQVSLSHMYTLCELDSELCNADYAGDLMLKTDGQLWIAGNKSGKRRLYVFFKHAECNLSEVSEQMKRICAAHFKNMFVLD